MSSRGVVALSTIFPMPVNSRRSRFVDFQRSGNDYRSSVCRTIRRPAIRPAGPYEAILPLIRDAPLWPGHTSHLHDGIGQSIGPASVCHRARPEAEADHPDHRCHRLSDGAARFHHHHHRDPGHRAQPGHDAGQAEPGDHHLYTDARRVHSRQRLVRRQVRRAQGVRTGAFHLHPRLGAVRHGRQFRHAAGHACLAGAGRCHDDAGRAADPAAQLSAQRPDRRHDLHDLAGHHGASHRAVARRPADHLRVVALDILRQRAVRLRWNPGGAALCRRFPRGSGAALRLCRVPDGGLRRGAAAIRAGKHRPADHSGFRDGAGAGRFRPAAARLRALCAPRRGASRRPDAVPVSLVLGRHAGGRPVPCGSTAFRSFCR